MLLPLLPQLSDFVRGRLGLHFPRERFADLERALSAAAPDFGFHEPSACAAWLLSGGRTDAEVASLAGHLTVGETYFFRDPQAFQALEETVLPELLSIGARPLRIWSAGCCTGEEAYSLAISVLRAAGEADQPAARIVATDINSRSLEKAAAGIYSEWSFRGVPADLRARYFQSVDAGKWEVLPTVREMVSFAPANLFGANLAAEVPAFGSMDVIFCRNVLMYFAPEEGRRLVANFACALREGGWLFTSAAEASHDLFGGLTRADLPGVSAFRKLPAAAPSDSAPLPPPPPPPAPEERPNAETHYLRALAFQEQGAPLEAADALRRTVILAPDFVLAHFALGNVLLRTASHGDARRAFDNARALLRQLHPDAPLPHGDGLTAARLLAVIAARQELAT